MREYPRDTRRNPPGAGAKTTVTSETNTATLPAHPLAGHSMTGADTVIQVIADEGVDTVFGYSGGAILPIYDAVFRYNDRGRNSDEKMRLIVPANEQGAGFMAAGYARASGQGRRRHGDVRSRRHEHGDAGS